MKIPDLKIGKTFELTSAQSGVTVKGKFRGRAFRHNETILVFSNDDDRFVGVKWHIDDPTEIQPNIQLRIVDTADELENINPFPKDIWCMES